MISSKMKRNGLLEAAIQIKVFERLTKGFYRFFEGDVELLKEIGISYRSAFYDFWGHKEEL